MKIPEYEFWKWVNVRSGGVVREGSPDVYVNPYFTEFTTVPSWFKSYVSAYITGKQPLAKEFYANTQNLLCLWRHYSFASANSLLNDDDVIKMAASFVQMTPPAAFDPAESDDDEEQTPPNNAPISVTCQGD